MRLLTSCTTAGTPYDIIPNPMSIQINGWSVFAVLIGISAAMNFLLSLRLRPFGLPFGVPLRPG